MKEDAVLVFFGGLVWLALAAVYALAPGLGMPGYVRVWGAGALVFFVLAGLLAAARRRS